MLSTLGYKIHWLAIIENYLWLIPMIACLVKFDPQEPQISSPMTVYVFRSITQLRLHPTKPKKVTAKKGPQVHILSPNQNVVGGATRACLVRVLGLDGFRGSVRAEKGGEVVSVLESYNRVPL